MKDNTALETPLLPQYKIIADPPHNQGKLLPVGLISFLIHHDGEKWRALNIIKDRLEYVMGHDFVASRFGSLEKRVHGSFFQAIGVIQAWLLPASKVP